MKSIKKFKQLDIEVFGFMEIKHIQFLMVSINK